MISGSDSISCLDKSNFELKLLYLSETIFLAFSSTTTSLDKDLIYFSVTSSLSFVLSIFSGCLNNTFLTSSLTGATFSGSTNNCFFFFFGLPNLVRSPNKSSNALIFFSSSFILRSVFSFSLPTLSKKFENSFSNCHSLSCLSGSTDKTSFFSNVPLNLASCNCAICFSISTSISTSTFCVNGFTLGT